MTEAKPLTPAEIADLRSIINKSFRSAIKMLRELPPQSESDDRKALAEAEFRNRSPGDPLNSIPTLWFDETGYREGPAIMWINPWDGKPEALCAFYWPSHPPEATEAVEHLYEILGHLFALSAEAADLIEQQAEQIEKLRLELQYARAYPVQLNFPSDGAAQ